MNENDGYEGFCTECGIDIPEFGRMEACPNCNATTQACAYKHQVNVSVNWQELRVLCMWAERFAREAMGRPGVVYSIARRLADQYPEFEDIPLTLAGEIAMLKKVYPDIVIVNEDGEEETYE